MRTVSTRVGLLLVLIFGLTACGISAPADPEHTLVRVSGGVLRIGISQQPPWTDTSGEEAPSGTEVELVEEFADNIDAQIEWEVGGEEELMTMLKERQLDMVVGGLTDKSPWTTHAALTTPYTESTGVDGKPEKHVMAVSMGENEFMVTLERFLLSKDMKP